VLNVIKMKINNQSTLFNFGVKKLKENLTTASDNNITLNATDNAILVTSPIFFRGTIR